MGLGADKVMLAAKASASSNTKEEEELKLVKGAYVKVLAGMQKNHYAQVLTNPHRVFLFHNVCETLI